VRVKEVRWVECGSQPEDDYIFSNGNKSDSNHLGQAFIVDKGITSTVKRKEFISDRMSYITLRGRWFDIIDLNVHAPNNDTIDDSQDSFSKK
jgi:hypothetical protein